MKNANTHTMGFLFRAKNMGKMVGSNLLGLGLICVITSCSSYANDQEDANNEKQNVLIEVGTGDSGLLLANASLLNTRISEMDQPLAHYLLIQSKKVDGRISRRVLEASGLEGEVCKIKKMSLDGRKVRLTERARAMYRPVGLILATPVAFGLDIIIMPTFIAPIISLYVYGNPFLVTSKMWNRFDRQEVDWSIRDRYFVVEDGEECGDFLGDEAPFFVSVSAMSY